MTKSFMRDRATIVALLPVLIAIVGFLALAYSAFAQQDIQVTQENGAPVTVASTTLIEPKVVDKGYTSDFVSSPSDVVVGDFVVGPGKTELTIKPGESRTVEIILTNRIGDTRDFNLEVEDAIGTNDPSTAVALLGTRQGPYTLRDYVQLPKATITLEHNERAHIPVTISVPADAEAGGRYGSILVTTVSKDAEVGNGGAAPSSAVIARVGTLFFLTIPGDTNIEGELHSFKTIPDKMIFTKGPVNFQILFENKGDLHLNPYGEVRVTNLFDEEVGFVELDPWFALPKSLRLREVIWDRELLIGRYTATAFINRGYDDIIDTESVSFWVIPWKVVIAVFGGLFIFSLLVRFIAVNFEFKRKSS